MDDIARVAGVSKPTVSRALQDSPLVSDETKRKILEIARRHGYVVNRNAQNLRRRRSDTIAVVIDFPHLPENRLSDPFHFELLGNIANALSVRQQDVLRSEEHTSELQSLMRISYAVFCLKNKTL